MICEHNYLLPSYLPYQVFFFSKYPSNFQVLHFQHIVTSAHSIRSHSNCKRSQKDVVVAVATNLLFTYSTAHLSQDPSCSDAEIMTLLIMLSMALYLHTHTQLNSFPLVHFLSKYTRIHLRVIVEVDTVQSGPVFSSQFTFHIISSLAGKPCHNNAEEANLLLRYLFGYKLLPVIALDNGNNNHNFNSNAK